MTRSFGLEEIQQSLLKAASLPEDAYWERVRQIAAAFVLDDPFFSANVEGLLDERTADDLLASGIDLLSQVAVGHPELRGAIAERLAQMRFDGRDDVAWSLAHGLGILTVAEAGPALLALSAYPRSDIRYQALRGISELLEGQLLGEETAIPALLQLAADEDEDNRDWATFALGSFVTSASDEVVEALWRRMTDDNPEVRGEALVGLARRGVADIVPILEEELQYQDVGTLQVEAASELGAPALHPLLLNLARRGWDDKPELLAEAIRNTAPDRS